MQITRYIDGQIPARSQGLTKKGFATHHRPGGRKWAICSQQGHTEGSLYNSSDSFLANSSAFLALKQKNGHRGGAAIGFKACVRFQYNCIDICTDSS